MLSFGGEGGCGCARTSPHPVAWRGHFRRKCGRCLVLAASRRSGLDLPALRRRTPFRALADSDVVGLPCVATFAPGGSFHHGLCSLSENREISSLSPRRRTAGGLSPRRGTAYSAVRHLDGELQCLRSVSVTENRAWSVSKTENRRCVVQIKFP